MAQSVLVSLTATAVCTKMLIDLTLGNTSKYWVKDDGGMCKGGICDTKPLTSDISETK